MRHRWLRVKNQRAATLREKQTPRPPAQALAAAQQQLSRSPAAPARRRSHLVDDAVHHEGVLQDVLPGPGVEEDA